MLWVICKNPKTKNTSRFVDLMGKLGNGYFDNLTDFEENAKEIFHSKPEDLVHDITITFGTDYINAVINEGIPLEYPYVQMKVVDYIYFGHCLSISFENLRTLNEHRNDQPGTDSSFYAIVWLKVSILFL